MASVIASIPSRLMTLCPRVSLTASSLTAGVRPCQWRVPVSLVLGRQLRTSTARRVILHIADDADFQRRVILGALPVVVNFHADWCEPCLQLTPLLEELLAHRSNIALCSLDIENHVRLLVDFDVKAVPAVLAFFNGQVVDKFVGLVNRPVVTEFVDRVIDRLNQHASIQQKQAELHRDGDPEH